MVEQVRISQEPEEVSSRLAELRLDMAPFRSAVWAGDRAAAGRTENDMPSARGYYRVNETLRELRDLLVTPQSGWKTVNDGLYTVRHEKLGIQIAVMSGNEGTGNPKRRPGAKNPRGSASEVAISVNNQQLVLPGIVELFDEHRAKKAAERRGQVLTWILLLFPVSGGVRCELLLPTEVKKGRIVDFTERIILGTFDFSSEANLEELDGYDAGTKFDVDVQPRIN